ncbi:MAG: nicotinamide mononucleotide transporter [Clostridia bacterium]|nr:nicotinamide mononucleotide transporter [Clostridia bacterium]
MNNKNILSKLNIPMWRLVMMAVTAVLISASWIVFPPENPGHSFQVIPLYVSLVVMILQSMANRYGQLLGALNSILYAAVYFFVFRTYGQAAYALAVSFPFQLATFINWSRRAYGNSAVFKKMSKKTALCITTLTVVFWVTCYFILSASGSDYIIFDNTITILGILCSVLSMLVYVEYVYIQIFTSVVGVFQYISMIFANGEISRMPHLIYGIYAAICVFLAWRKITALYAEQNKKAEE